LELVRDPKGVSPRHGRRFGPERAATALVRGLTIGLTIETRTVCAFTLLDVPAFSPWG
jgi:hypothetical protein